MLQERLVKAEEEAKTLNKEVGDAAGPSSDWHDNFEYEDAKRRLEQKEKEIQVLKTTISDCELADTVDNCSCVSIGNRVRVEIDGKEQTLIIVGHEESDPKKNLVAYDTPLGEALMDQELGKTFSAKIGEQERIIKIIDITIPD
jgi:transcription elongation factor GreA